MVMQANTLVALADIPVVESADKMVEVPMLKWRLACIEVAALAALEVLAERVQSLLCMMGRC